MSKDKISFCLFATPYVQLMNKQFSKDRSKGIDLLEILSQIPDD